MMTADFEDEICSEAVRAKATLRDQFAMAALTGIMSNASLTDLFAEIARDESLKNTNGLVTAYAFELADAMLKARQEGK